CFRYDIEMKLSGEMRFRKDTGAVPAKLAASASHAFPERVLLASGGVVTKSARLYETARVSITRGTDTSTCELRPSRRLIVAQRDKDQPLAYSPAGALYRNELELVSGHFDTLTLAGLLPGKAVKKGETWKVPNLVAQALCGLEGMTENKLEGRLESGGGDLATLAVSGTAAGVEAGALVKVTIDAAASFDARAKRLTRVVWKQKCQRDQGPVSPASSMEVNVTLTRKAIEQPADL